MYMEFMPMGELAAGSSTSGTNTPLTLGPITPLPLAPITPIPLAPTTPLPPAPITHVRRGMRIPVDVEVKDLLDPASLAYWGTTTRPIRLSRGAIALSRFWLLGSFPFGKSALLVFPLLDPKQLA
jgi:hypothetical protein